MFKLFFDLFYWMIIASLGVGGMHLAANKMRQMALEAVARPWPSLHYEMKQNNDRDPFIVVKKDGHPYLVHKDRLGKKHNYANPQQNTQKNTKKELSKKLDKAINLYADIFKVVETIKN